MRLATCFCAATLAFALPAVAQDTPSHAVQASSVRDPAWRTELVGAPVFAADGAQIGRVADVFIDSDGHPAKIRMTGGRTLGLGARAFEIPGRLFTVLRGAVVVDLPAEAVQVLPELTEQADDR